MRHRIRILLIAVLLLALAIEVPAQSSRPALTPRIAIDAGRDLAPVPRRLFGTNLRPNMQQHEPVRRFLRQTGITLFRYPDAIDHGYTWDWEAGGVMTAAKGPLISRLSHFDNLVELAKDVKAEVFFTVKIHDTTPEEAARWVAEAKRRGLGGMYWCFGNEPYFKGDRYYIPKQAYVELVNRFAPVMKQADPEIKLGIAWGGPFIEEQTDPGRDSFVLHGTQQWVDFIDFHFYTGRWEPERGIDAKRIMAGSLLVRERAARFREIFRREAPQKADQIQIHYWEWNGPPWRPFGGIQTLATALFAADALGEMARCGVSAAIQYNLQEHACGLIPGWDQAEPQSWPTQDWNGRTVRPVAYAVQLWSRHMGPTLVQSSIWNVGSYRTEDWHTQVNYQGEVPLLAAHATRGADHKSLQLLVVNRDEVNATEVLVSIEGFTPAARAAVLTLSAPSALSHNDVIDRPLPYNSFADAPEPIVKITPSERTLSGPTFRHSFPPHSVTVILMQSR